ncbi:MAG: K+/H+ antiporter subunit F [Deltaproteobacteria bacterium]|nr:MAG: K+/H+ antiporter subunit F [Deltaproteobacteria bacterium]
MIPIALTIGFSAVMVSMFMALFRLIRGPRLVDRILALDTLSINAIALLMLVGIYLRSDMFFEAALLIAMLGFVGTVSLSKHAVGRSVIE